MIAHTASHQPPLQRRWRLQFGVRALLVLATAACIFFTFLYVDNRHRLAKRNALALRFETLNVEFKRRMEEYLDFVRPAPVYKRGEHSPPTETVEEQERILKHLQNETNKLSLEISSMDVSSPTLYQRMQSFFTPPND